MKFIRVGGKGQFQQRGELRPGRQNGSFLSGGVRTVKSLASHGRFVWGGGRQQKICNLHWFLNDEYKCQPKILHIVPEACKPLRRFRKDHRWGWSPKFQCQLGITKRRWKIIPSLSATGRFLGKQITTDVSETFRRGAISSFSPTGALHYTVKREGMEADPPGYLIPAMLANVFLCPADTLTDLSEPSIQDPASTGGNSWCCLGACREPHWCETGRLCWRAGQHSPAVSLALMWHPPVGATVSGVSLLGKQLALTRASHSVAFWSFKIMKSFLTHLSEWTWVTFPLQSLGQWGLDFTRGLVTPLYKALDYISLGSQCPLTSTPNTAPF